jgi:hypothetical protein
MALSSQVEEAGAELISVLPAGALHRVFDFLEPRSLCAVGATCRQWRGLQGDAAANQARRCCSQHLAPDHTASCAAGGSRGNSPSAAAWPLPQAAPYAQRRPCFVAASLPWVH